MQVDSVLTISEQEMTRKQWRRLLNSLTFVDTNEVEVAAFTHKQSTNTIVIPRGAWNMLPDLAVTDLRSCPPMPKMSYAKVLDAEGYEGQIEAVQAMMAAEQGQVIAPPGRGKTEIGLAFAATCKTRTLIVVHTKDLFDQWVSRASTSVPGMEVGTIKGKSCTIGHVTIAMAQTLKRYVGAGGKFWRQFGCVIIDEAHHAAAETWEWILNVCPAFYRFGLTATDKRADGRHPLVRFILGPVIFRIKFHSQVPLAVQPVRTGFGLGKVVYRGPNDWSRMLRILSSDPLRNKAIAKRVVAEMVEGHTILVLSRQIKHLEHIGQAIFDEYQEQCGTESDDVALLTGNMPQSFRLATLDDFRAGRIRVVLATQLADEGLDVPRLDRVHLTFPGKHDGRIIQQIGRAIRQYPDKEDALVSDYVDDLVVPLARQYVARKSTYKELAITTREAVGYGTEKRSKRTKRPVEQWKVARR